MSGKKHRAVYRPQPRPGPTRAEIEAEQVKAHRRQADNARRRIKRAAEKPSSRPGMSAAMVRRLNAILAESEGVTIPATLRAAQAAEARLADLMRAAEQVVQLAGERDVLAAMLSDVAARSRRLQAPALGLARGLLEQCAALHAALEGVDDLTASASLRKRVSAVAVECTQAERLEQRFRRFRQWVSETSVRAGGQAAKIEADLLAACEADFARFDEHERLALAKLQDAFRAANADKAAAGRERRRVAQLKIDRVESARERCRQLVSGLDRREPAATEVEAILDEALRLVDRDDTKAEAAVTRAETLLDALPGKLLQAKETRAAKEAEFAAQLANANQALAESFPDLPDPRADVFRQRIEAIAELKDLSLVSALIEEIQTRPPDVETPIRDRVVETLLGIVNRRGFKLHKDLAVDGSADAPLEVLATGPKGSILALEVSFADGGFSVDRKHIEEGPACDAFLDLVRAFGMEVQDDEGNVMGEGTATVDHQITRDADSLARER